MEIDLVFKIAAIGIIVAVLNQLLIRSGREDQAMMTTLAGLVVVLAIAGYIVYAVRHNKKRKKHRSKYSDRNY